MEVENKKSENDVGHFSAAPCVCVCVGGGGVETIRRKRATTSASFGSIVSSRSRTLQEVWTEGAKE